MSITIERSCEFCKNIFQASKKEVNRGNGRFCSISCAAKRKRSDDAPNFECSHCTKPIRVKQSKLSKGKTGLHFCSRECMNEHEWRAVRGDCEFCHQKLKAVRKTTIFCDTKCQRAHDHATFIIEWLDGIRNGACGEGVSQHIRTWLFEKHDSKCQECGWSKVHSITGRIPLTINHIDGDWKNNRPENLELLCPNCHSLTSNYGALNRGNGRPRRLRKLREKMEVVDRERVERSTPGCKPRIIAT
jgi:5-methylcytosine-specific restriction endonuclease McrA